MKFKMEDLKIDLHNISNDSYNIIKTYKFTHIPTGISVKKTGTNITFIDKMSVINYIKARVEKHEDNL